MNNHIRVSAIREAFIAAQVTRATSAATVNACAHALLGKGGMFKERDWNASLSFETAKKLGAPAFERSHVPMRYDQMVHG